MTTPIQFPGSPVRPGGPTPPGQTQAITPAGGQNAVAGNDFKSVLLDSLNEVNRLQGEADQGVQRLLTGETDNVAEVFNAINKAGIAFDLLMEIRNKLTDAYKEVQQMRV